MELLEKLAEICSNGGYAAIIAAIIGAIAVIAAAVYNKHKKGASDSPTVILIPPEKDRLSDLNTDTDADPFTRLSADPAGVKDIDKDDIYDPDYIRILATRLELLKNPGSEADVFYDERGDHHD